MRAAPAPPPRALVVAAGVVVVAGVVISAVGAWRIGVSNDETYHVERMTNYLHLGWFSLTQDLQNGQPADWQQQTYVYGPVAMILLHAWSLLLGVDGHGVVSASAHAYAVRHLGVVLISLVGLVATAATTRLITRSWGWGLVSAAVLVAVPTWTGQAMFNVKDIPVAVGYSLATLGVVVVAQAGVRRWVALGALTTVAGVVLAVGTRPGIAPGLGLAGAVALAVVAVRRQWPKAAVLVASGLVSVGALTAIYPRAFADPVKALVDGATQSEHFDGQSVPWTYVPYSLVIQIPTLLLLLGAVGTVVGLLRVRWDGGRVSTETLTTVLVVLQTFTLPVLAVARHSNLYNGLRQLIFATPGLAVLATCALVALWPRPTAFAARARRVLVPVLAVVAVGVPMVAQAQLFPYGYAYSSIPAGITSVAARLDAGTGTGQETDYWRTSVRELAPDIPAVGYVVCTPNLDYQGHFMVHGAAMIDTCQRDPYGPLRPYDADLGGTPVTDPLKFVAVAAGGSYLGTNCTRTGSVTRHQLWRTVTMSLVAVCDLVLDAYPPGGITFYGPGSQFLVGDWEARHDEPGTGMQSGSGEVAFGLPADLVGSAVRITGTGLDLPGLAVSVNGTPVPVHLTGTDAFALDVPADVADAYGQGRLVMTLTGPDTLRLTGVQVTGAPS